MRYRRLGNTGLVTSEIGFGTIPILSGDIPVLPDYYSPDAQEAVALMKYAFDKGCTMFDTAIVPEYGDAEIKLGLFAAAVGREKIIISDKARYFTGDEMYNAVTNSCHNLQSYADIYFVHQVDEDHEDTAFGQGGAVEALCQLKREGKIRFAGIASHYYDILLRGARDNRVDVLQGSGNILERGMLDRLENEPLFSTKGFILNKVYAAGILPDFFPETMLVSGVLSYPISCAIIGLGRYDDIDTAMEGDFADRESHPLGINSNPQDYARPSFSSVLSRLEKDFPVIPCNRCQKCSCPFGTEIHTLFRQYNYYFLGKNYWALRKLDLGIEISAHHCKECLSMACLNLCPDHINIPDTIEKIKDLVVIHIRNSII